MYVFVFTKSEICETLVYPEIIDDDSVDRVGHPALCVCIWIDMNSYVWMYVCNTTKLHVHYNETLYMWGNQKQPTTILTIESATQPCLCVFQHVYSHVWMYVCMTMKPYMHYNETLYMWGTCLPRNSRRWFCRLSRSPSLMCVYLLMYRYVCMFTCMYVCIYVCMYVCIYVYMFVCMCVCMHVCMYIYIHV